MKPVISIKNISKHSGTLEILKGISFDVEAGRVTAIIGPSGSGKTTLLRCINLLTQINSGEITVGDIMFTSNSEDIDTRKLREHVGIVFQQFNLWPHRTVLENLIEAPIRVKKIPRQRAAENARELLKRIGLLEKQNAYPVTLSGGEQQRVAIARALIMEPKILLLDEITSALDPELVGEVLTLVREIAEEHKRTIIIVTHEMGFA